MKLLLSAIFTLGLINVVIAQTPRKPNNNKKQERRQRIDALVKQEEEGVIAYRKSSAYAGKLNSDGYGVSYEIGRAQSIRWMLLFQLELSERKHPKELKQSNPSAPTAPIIYGKQNFFYPIKLGVQEQYLLGNKSNKNGVSVSANVGGGLTLALLRPYEVQVDKLGVRTYVRYNSPDSLLFINGPYYGGPNFSRGWKNLKITPGFYAKAALRFDYGRFNEIISALEVGLQAEAYTKKIAQMLSNKQRQTFFSAYVTLLFGKRK
jgi:hypothetical protein